MVHFLQSNEWMDFQRSLGNEVYSRAGDGWSFVAVIEKTKLTKRLYCPYGPVLTDAEAATEAIDELKKLAKNHNCDFIRIEPTGVVNQEILRKNGATEVSYVHMQPQRTQIIDLSPAPELILADMKQNNRNIYRNIRKKGVDITISQNPDDIGSFLELIHKVSKRTNLVPHSDNYFKKQATTLFNAGAAKLYLAHYEGKTIAAAICFDGDDTRYYAHAAADDDFRKLSAGTALLAQMILDAKNDGKQYFDLYGIAPENSPNHKWAGFTKFKQSFGGSPFTYQGLYEIPLHVVKYYCYKLGLSLYNKLRK